MMVVFDEKWDDVSMGCFVMLMKCGFFKGGGCDMKGIWFMGRTDE